MLIILAGVSIAMLVGENGIITQAQRAAQETEQAQVEEQKQLAMLDAATHLSDYKYTDVSGTEVNIPAKFAVSQIEGENTLANGLVIIDINGNEYVWIEVPKTITQNAETIEDIYLALETYVGDYNKGSVTQTYNTWNDEWYDSNSYTYRDGKWYTCYGIEDNDYNGNLQDTEGCGVTYQKYNELKEKMLMSIKNNGGFWIGRYEAGVSIPRTSHTEILEDTTILPLSKRDLYPINYVYCSEAQILSEKVSTSLGVTNYTSSLLFGIQWDLVMKYLETRDSNISYTDLAADSTQLREL